MLKRRLFLAFSGVDGSGKTTQVQLLEKRLREANFHVTTVWCRWRPVLSLPLLSILERLGYAKTRATSSIGFVETRISNLGGLAFLWSLLTQIDNFMKNGLKVMIPLFLGRTVICDRYVLDMLVEGMAGLHDPPNRVRLGYRLLGLLPRPDNAFLIEMDPAVAFERKPDMPTLSHFAERVSLYRELARAMRVRTIDGRLPIQAIHGEIWAKVSRALHS